MIWRRSLMVLLAIMLFGGLLGPVQATSADGLTSQARIALFLNPEGDQGFRQVSPVITLSSPGGLAIDVEGAGLRQYWLQRGGQEKVSFSLNQYTLQIVTTTQRQEALIYAQSLTNAHFQPVIQVLQLHGQPLYRVTTGSYATLESAKQGAAQVQAAVQHDVSILGPYQLISSPYTSIAEASQLQQQVLQSGIEAFIGEELTAQGIEYRVGVGQALSADGLAILRQQLMQVLPAISWTDSHQLATPLLWRWEREEPTLTASSFPHYRLSGGVNLYVNAEATGTQPPLIRVDEKYQRLYRGTMELRPLRGALALINQLPVEEYLYGVVGAEMAGSWPVEALKAQSVLARTYYYGLGNKYGVATASDSTFEQAYKGYLVENERLRQAVDGTRDLVLYHNQRLAQALYYSNAGGVTAHGSEVWGNNIPYLQPVVSYDSIATLDKPLWYQVELPDGQIGYIRHDLLTLLPETNGLNLQLASIRGDRVNVRSGPSTTDHSIIAKVTQGTKVTILGQQIENNAYEWKAGPYTGAEIQAMLQGSPLVKVMLSQPVQHLQVSERGPSKRVLQVNVDGQSVSLSAPDSYRALFRNHDQSLRSNRFTIEELGSYQILGANGVQNSKPETSAPLYAIGASQSSYPLTQERESFLVYDQGGQLRQVTAEPQFLFHGNGFGHGLGLSQYGAKAMAEQGADYLAILHHYFTDQVEIRPHMK